MDAGGGATPQGRPVDWLGAPGIWTYHSSHVLFGLGLSAPRQVTTEVL